MTEKYDGYTITFSASHGYPTIFVNGKNILLHRYVWEKYHGSIPKGNQIHHKDGNKNNFDPSNLELVSTHDHLKSHAIEHGLGRSNKGKPKRHQSGSVPINHPVILKKDEETLYFESMTDAKNYLGLKGTNSISNALNGLSKTAKGWTVCDAK